MSSEIWISECRFIGAWRAGKRWCILFGEWKSKEECEKCFAELKPPKGGIKNEDSSKEDKSLQ